MKKTALIIISLLLSTVLLSYILLFTTIGNNLLQPSIEAKINENSPIKVKLSKFLLRMDRIKVLIKLDEQNTILAEGSYSLFSQSFDIDYTIALNKLSNLNKLAERKLSGKLLSDGNINGGLDLFKIKGKSDIALSQTDYAIVIKEMKLDKAALKLTNAQIKELLSMVGEKPYATGKIDLHLQLNDLNPENLKGSVALNIKEALLNEKTLKKELGLSLTKTGLKGELKAKLEANQINYLARVDSELANIFSKGEMQTTNTSVNSTYKIDIKELALFKSLTKAPLRGPFFTQGEIKGKNKSYKIEGKSNIADSKTLYSLKLLDFKPSKLILNIQDAKLEKLLYMAGEQKYASARLNANIQLNNLNPKRLVGKAELSLREGKVDQKIMLKTFKVTLPKTSFTLKTKTVIKPENINYTFSLLSNLAKIDSKGDINPQSIQTKADYLVDIKELALLKPLTSSPLRGPLATSGTLRGDKKELLIKGSSDLAQSKTNYILRLEELSPKSAEIDIKKAKLSKLLYLAGEPSYAIGDLDMSIKLDSISSLNGKIKMLVSKGLVNKKVVKKAFDINLPYTKFELNSNARIKEDKLTAKTKIISNLATLNMKKSDFDIKKASLRSDYDIFIPFLERLEPLLERRLFGEVRASGKIKKDKQLIITAHSKIFRGQINAKVIDDKVTSDFKDIHAIDILKILGYKEVMDAPLNGDFIYNTKTKEGKLYARFDKATLTRSKMTDLIKGLSRTDLTKERFNKGSLLSLINKDIISSELKMQSKRASLRSKKFLVNSKKQVIDARFALKIKEYAGDVILKGDINSPSVKLDAKSMITPEIEKKVGKEINRFLKKLF